MFEKRECVCGVSVLETDGEMEREEDGRLNVQQCGAQTLCVTVREKIGAEDGLECVLV